ncbi:class I adenylate-forming enzyme family protein [Alkalihalobacillus sp. BA299]|uniref:class I adenylate-forming enzyme family protein n=1 Tax=Alkalihalobacillus sp. BA299 TaxID=2815938 RepID=UPI001ADB03AD|nr:class I adenylate-forming enzyme family protein [Alkalihalobacillus sp. BA299]
MLVKETELFGRGKIKVFNDRPSNLAEVLSTSLEAYKDKEAVVTEESSLTYEQLDAYSTVIAANLQKEYGVQKGDRIATLIGNRLSFPLMVFACVKLGAIMVPVNVKLSVDEIAYILGHSEVKVIVSEDKFISKIEKIKEVDITTIPKDENIFVVDGENTFKQLLEDKNELLPIETDELDPIFILYTSGTTGRPKGAVLTHINVIHSLINFKSIFETDHTMKTLIAVPMFHVTGLVGQLLHMVYIGGTAYSMESYKNKLYIEYILKYRINFLFNVPTIFVMMSTDEQFKQNSFDFVTKVAFGGSPIYQQTYSMLQEAFPNANLHNAYGATETTSPATLMPVSYSKSKVTSVGRAVPVADIKIVSSTGDEVAAGEVGELFIKGPMVIKEYWRNEEANQHNFSDGYWHSGDLGSVDEDGYFYISDRKKDMINRGGEKIFSIEVEDILKKHNLIKEAAVVGDPDPVFGERVKAFIVSEQLTIEDIPLIKQHCLQYLAKFKVPEIYEFLDELPRNASGKILKQTLKNN